MSDEMTMTHAKEHFSLIVCQTSMRSECVKEVNPTQLVCPPHTSSPPSLQKDLIKSGAVVVSSFKNKNGVLFSHEPKSK